MTTEQLKSLHASGMEIGGHTSHHPILAGLDSANARQEIAEGKEYLQDVLGAQIKLFAYPNGKPGVDYLAEQAEIVSALGFDAAVSTQAGVAHHASDLFQLPRVTPWYSSAARYVPAFLYNLYRYRQAAR